MLEINHFGACLVLLITAKSFVATEKKSASLKGHSTIDAPTSTTWKIFYAHTSRWEARKRERSMWEEQRTPRTMETHKKGTWSVWITNHCPHNRKYLLENNHQVVIDSEIYFWHVIVALLSRGGLSDVVCFFLSGRNEIWLLSAVLEPLCLIYGLHKVFLLLLCWFGNVKCQPNKRKLGNLQFIIGSYLISGRN